VSASTPTAGFCESLLVIGPQGTELVGVLAQPAEAAIAKSVGVVIVVGGPQTRVGSHRQFVLMARALAQAGYPCLRFDYTGMGDSPGVRPDFELAGPDIRRACDALLSHVPDCTRLALWGLCDGASAALIYASGDERIGMVIAANPWARSDATRSAALVSDHYSSRLRSREFWMKLLSGKVDIFAAARESIRHLIRARMPRRSVSDLAQPQDLPARLARALLANGGRVRLQLSGRDLTAAEFEIAIETNSGFVECDTGPFRLTNADHTFSDPQAWRSIIEDTLHQLSLVGGQTPMDASQPSSLPSAG
jgi:exosortase A-associated hydrolase 1